MTRLRSPLHIVLAGLALIGCRDPHMAHVTRGNEALAAGRLQDAAHSYTMALEARPDSGVARFNLGYAYYQEGDFAGAEHAFAIASLRLGGDAQARAFYNLGNALAGQGKLRAAVSAYEASLRLLPDDDDARYNVELVRRWLEQQDQDSRSDRADPRSRRRLTAEDASRSLDDLMSGLRAFDSPASDPARPDW